jgi:D-alanyl-D-alanine dipeptidase
VRLSESDPTIIQEIRYFGSHNFVGRPIDSYNAAECILTDQAAHALSLVQLGMLSQNLSLKVYDCYRPQSAVNDFMVWALNNDTDTKKEFYPLVSKPDIFPDGSVASKSGHSRGSTVDLTIVPCCPAPPQPA